MYYHSKVKFIVRDIIPENLMTKFQIRSNIYCNNKHDFDCTNHFCAEFLNRYENFFKIYIRSDLSQNLTALI